MARFTSGAISIESATSFDGCALAVSAVLASFTIGLSQATLRELSARVSSVEADSASLARTAISVCDTAVRIRIGSTLVGSVTDLATTALSVGVTALRLDGARVINTNDARVSTAHGVRVTTAGNIVALVGLGVASFARVGSVTISIGETTLSQGLDAFADVGIVVASHASLRSTRVDSGSSITTTRSCLTSRSRCTSDTYRVTALRVLSTTVRSGSTDIVGAVLASRTSNVSVSGTTTYSLLALMSNSVTFLAISSTLGVAETARSDGSLDKTRTIGSASASMTSILRSANISCGTESETADRRTKSRNQHCVEEETTTVFSTRGGLSNPGVTSQIPNVRTKLVGKIFLQTSSDVDISTVEATRGVINIRN